MQRFTGLFVLCIAGWLCVGSAAAQPATAAAADLPAALRQDLAALRERLPHPGRLLNAAAADAWVVAGEPARVVTFDGVPGGRATRATVETLGDDPWSTQARQPIAGDIHEGDTVFIALWVRNEKSYNESQSALLPAITVQRSGPPWTSAGAGSASAGAQWRRVYVSGRARGDLPDGAAELAVHLAPARQTVDLGPAYVINLGPDVDPADLPQNELDYPGRAPDAAWRAKADARIAAVRTGPLELQVVDADGRPVPGAKVHAKLARHAFGFGTFLGQDPNAGDAEAAKLREILDDGFDYATASHYWQDWGWPSADGRKRALGTMRFLKDRGVPYRTHVTVYPHENNWPTFVRELKDDPAAMRKAVLDHTREVMGHVRRLGARSTDVVNEPRHGPHLADALGREVYVEIFNAAREAAPDVELFLNDFGILNNGGHNTANVAFYHELIREMLEAGAPLGGIGFQGHFGSSLTPLPRLIEVLDDFAQYGLPLHITEFDIDTLDEAGRADYTRDALTAAFSHPAVEAFVIWGVLPSPHWLPHAAPFTEDLEPKPVYHAWKKLVKETWHTDEHVRTDEGGVARLRGYYGDYDLTLTAPGGAETAARVTHEKGGGPVRVTLEP